MAEVLAEYDAVVRARDQSRWAARAIGREREDGMYDAWIEFVPILGTESPVRSSRETTQPDRGAAHYWAQGITPTYLEGALERARRRRSTAPLPTQPPLFATPATRVPASASVPRSLRAAIDPFEVAAEGPAQLDARLRALSTDRLRDIAIVYELASMDAMFTLSRDALIALVEDAVHSEDAARTG